LYLNFQAPWLQRNAGAETKSVASEAKKVLLIEHNKVVLKSLTFLLAGKGYRVMAAETGSEALGIMRKKNRT
jgi:CheY-like chemotaxis protein